MSKKTCKDCLHCTVDDRDVLCVDMPWHYPFGGSDKTTFDKDACEYFIERKTTVFDKITANEEALAEKLVYYIEGKHSPFGRRWKSTLTGDVCYVNRSSALEATIEELKKEER